MDILYCAFKQIFIYKKLATLWSAFSEKKKWVKRTEPRRTIKTNKSTKGKEETTHKMSNACDDAALSLIQIYIRLFKRKVMILLYVCACVSRCGKQQKQGIQREVTHSLIQSFLLWRIHSTLMSTCESAFLIWALRFGN